MRFRIFSILGLGLSLGLASCALKAKVVGPPLPETKPQVAAKPAVTEPVGPTLPPQGDDEMRMPDMLGMPGERELKSSTPKEAEGGAVISRPPAEAATPEKKE